MAEAEATGLDLKAARAPITTRRLYLRAPAVADVPALTRLVNEPLIARNTSSIRYPYGAIEGWRFVRGSMRTPRKGGFASFLVTLRGNPRLIAGGAGFDWHEGGAPEVGYWIAAAYRRQGFAKEVTRALLSRIFTGTAVQTVRARARVENAASQRVLTRSGFRRIGAGKSYSRMLRRYVRVVLFAIRRADWERGQVRQFPRENPDAHL